MPVNYKKINNLIESITTMDGVNWYDVLTMDKEIEDKLFTFQIYCVYELLVALQINNIILNGSDTGTGKTYVTAAVCKQGIIKNGVKKSLKPIIFCKKSLITYWKNVLSEFGIEAVAVINYELVTGNRVSDDFKYKDILKIDHMNSTPKRFKWSVKDDYCIVFDEVHECKNPNSLHGKLLLSTKNIGVKIMMLSATVSAMPKDFAIFGLMLGFYDTIKKGKSWVLGKMQEDKRSLVKVRTSSVNKEIYPHKGSRMDISELDDSFSKNNIVAMPYDLDSELVELFNSKYKLIQQSKLNKENKKSKTEFDNNNNINTNTDTDIEYETEKEVNKKSGKLIAEIQTARAELENYKVPMLTELAKEYVEEGFNVVIFVSFTNTIKKLATSLQTENILNGDTNQERREYLINAFQTNKINLLICNVKAGGNSISLHNKLGRPTVSLITSQISGIDLKQVLGRIYRAGVTGYVLQRLIYCVNTIEAELWNGVKEKIKFIDNMNGKELNIFSDE
jgi:hypothetical protein